MFRPTFLLNKDGGDGGDAALAPENTDGSESSKPDPGLSKSEVVGIVKDHVTRGVKAALGESMGSFKEDIAKMIQGGFQQNPEPQDSASSTQPEEDPPPKDQDSGTHETPMETQIRRLSARLDSMEKEKGELTSKLEEKEKLMSLKDRNSKILEIAAPLSKKPDQVLSLVSPMVIEDAEKGWVVEVDGEYGKEFRPLDEFVPEWLEENPHFKKVASSGSGAGAGGQTGVGGLPKIDVSRLNDPAYYAENRDIIVKHLETRAGR